MSDESMKQMLRGTGLSVPKVEGIVREPDAVEHLKYDGAILHLHIKRIPSSNPPSVVLVVTADVPDPKGIAFVAKLYDEERTGAIQLMSPTVFLWHFAGRFGDDILVGTETRKLFLCESIPLTRGTIRAPRAAHQDIEHITLLISRTEARKLKEHCVFVIACDLARYRTHLMGQPAPAA